MLQINLSGKIAVVTGASGELGRVMVRTLASCGADVAIHYLQNQKKASELAEEVENICHQYINTIKLGKPTILSSVEMNKILEKVKNYKKD